MPDGTSPALRARFEQLSPADQVRLLARLNARSLERTDEFRIPRRGDRRAPLTFAQQGVWFVQQLDLDGPVWNLSRTWTVRGPLDVTALERALSEISRRHEALRTRYLVVDGAPVQEVMPPQPVAIERVDLDRLDGGSDDEAAASLRRRIATRPFDLTSQPTLRAGVARFGADRCELTIARHHISSDQWSSGLLRRELSTLYDDFAAGRGSSLTDLPLQFNDYAWWADAEARQPAAAGELAGAVAALAGMPERSGLLPAPAEPLPAFGRGGRVTVAIPASTVRGLRALAQAHVATLFMALMAIFNAVVHRHTNQTDIVVVTPTAGRVHPDLESLIGLFANVAPLRTDLTGDPSFLDLLERVRHGTLRLLSYQHVPIQRLQAALRPHWSPGRMTMSSLLFALQNVPQEELRLTGMDVHTVESAVHPVAEDVALFTSEDRDGALALRADYRVDRADEPTIRRLVEDVVAVAAHVAATPAARLSELPVRSGSSTRTRSGSPGHTPDAAWPRDARVQDLVERQAARTPDADAVIDGANRSSYRAVDTRANRLAHYLRAFGAGPGSVVSVCLQRSPDLMIALLGILKSGAAYVPLDPGLPARRLRFMLDVSAAALHVTSDALADRLGGQPGLTVRVDADAAAIAAMPDGAPDRLGTPDDLAYVMFTSGSTGRPKGVAMPHRALVNLLSWHVRHPRLQRPARTLQFAPVSFDVSFQDIVGTWCTGGAVVLVHDDTRRDPVALLRYIDEQEIERLYLPVAALTSLAAAHAASPRRLVKLRDIIAAGEALHVTPEIRRLCAAATDCHLHNHYGPTEAHVVTAHELDGPPDGWPGAVPIGRPLTNVEIRILDPEERPVADYEAGELYIGGESLAHGYYRRADLTAERFIDDPARPGARLYRTGDRGRWRPDGTLEFLGRLDDQVKLSGHRVEPGEVEAVLAECPGIRQALVVLREDRPGDKRLVGYYVATAGAVSPGSIQAHLRQRLPPYMLPAALMELTALPITAHGKVDRAALPDVPAGRRTQENGAAPGDPIEGALVALWADVLGVKGLGIDDNFFERGGHSILAATLLLRAERIMGHAPALSVFFEGPTIRQLAHAFRGNPSREVHLGLTWLADASPDADRRRHPLVVLPSMFGDVFQWRGLLGGITSDRAIYGLELLGPQPYWTQNPTIREIAARSVEVLLRDLSDRRVHLIGHSFGGVLGYEIGQQLRAAGQPPASVIIVDTGTRRLSRRITWRDLRSIAANVPRWITNELSLYGAPAIARGVLRRLPSRKRAADGGLGRMFDLPKFPEGYQRRLKENFNAFTAYRPAPTHNRVVFLRSRVRSLIHSDRPDGGWGALVPAPLLTVLPIPGDHGSALHERWRSSLRSTLEYALDRVETDASERPYPAP